MLQQSTGTQTSAAAFDTVAAADQALQKLGGAGFSEAQLAVICPEKFQEHFRHELPHSETPRVAGDKALAIGGATGATLGGLALAASVLTGGLGGLAAVGVFIGGGAIAGGFSYLIVSHGYEKEVDDDIKRAVQQGQIVVGVEIPASNVANRIADAQRILAETGGKLINRP